MARVLLLTYHLPTPDEPGAGRPWGEATLLRDLGHDVTVVTSGTQYLTGANIRKNKRGFWSEESFDNIRIIKTYAPQGYRKSMVRRIANYIVFSLLSFAWAIRHNFDFIFMGTDPLFLVPFGFILSRIKRTKLVLDERDLFPETAVALGSLKPGYLTHFISIWHRFVCKKADWIIAATPGIMEMLLEKGIPANKMMVLPNAFPPKDLNGKTLETVPIQNGAGKNFTVLYAGGMGLANELMTVLKAAQILQTANLPIKFIFVGEGERKLEYSSYCKKNALLNCQFLSVLPRSQMSALLEQADVCVHSLKADPFWRCALSSKIFDYLASGKPIIFAGIGDISDLLQKSGAGISVPPEDPSTLASAIQRLYSEPDIRIEMGKKAKLYMEEHFSIKSQMECLEKVFPT